MKIVLTFTHLHYQQTPSFTQIPSWFYVVSCLNVLNVVICEKWMKKNFMWWSNIIFWKPKLHRNPEPRWISMMSQFHCGLGIFLVFIRAQNTEYSRLPGSYNSENFAKINYLLIEDWNHIRLLRQLAYQMNKWIYFIQIFACVKIIQMWST